MRGSKQLVLVVAAVLVVGGCLVAPSEAGAQVPVVVKNPESKIVGKPTIGCDAAKLTYVLDGGNLAATCEGKTTMVGPGWRAYGWPEAVGASYHYVSASTAPPEDGSEVMSFFPTITAPGFYEVWASYRGSENRSPATPFYVYTDSNVTYKIVVNQAEHGSGGFFSVKLGTFYFKAHSLNQSPRTTGIVACVNEGARTSEAVDAVFLKYVRPAAPTGVAASDRTWTKTIGVRWKGVAGAKSYKIFRNSVNNAKSAQLIATVGAAVRTYLDTPLGEGQTYYYWVKSVGALGKMSAFSAGNQGSTGVTAPAQ